MNMEFLYDRNSQKFSGIASPVEPNVNKVFNWGYVVSQAGALPTEQYPPTG